MPHYAKCENKSFMSCTIFLVRSYNVIEVTRLQSDFIGCNIQEERSRPGTKYMDYKNDNRTPRDRITGEFLSELLFTDLGGDSCCEMNSGTERNCDCRKSVSEERRSVGATATPKISCRQGCAPRSRIEPGVCGRNTCRHSHDNNVELTGNYSLAMAYVQMQKFEDLFDIDNGFCEGTIFKGLRFPFYPTPCRKEFDR